MCFIHQPWEYLYDLMIGAERILSDIATRRIGAEPVSDFIAHKNSWILKARADPNATRVYKLKILPAANSDKRKQSTFWAILFFILFKLSTIPNLIELFVSI